MNNKLTRFSSLIFRNMVILLFIFASTRAYAYPADAIDISGGRYYPAVKNALDSAKKSIFMVMYIVSFNAKNDKSLVSKLCRSLASARKRGVEVKIILDQNIDFMNKKKEYTPQASGKNSAAFKFFKENGINVLYDNRITYTHNKIIVIDQETIILGSTNWSEAALTKNNESSVLIKSRELAGAFLRDLSSIKVDDEANKLAQSKLKEEKEGSLAIYGSFMEDKDLAPRMLTAKDERVFDLYLLLLKEFQNDALLDFDYDKAANSLGIDKKMGKNQYRRQINKTLRKLEEKYKLIEFKPEFGRNAKVKLLAYKEPGTYKQPKDNYFSLPREYFIYDWDKKLSFRAKYCYLINLYKASLSLDNPWWAEAGTALSKQFHVHQDTLVKGMRELRRLNLIDIKHSSVEKGYKHRRPNWYKALNLYSPLELEEKWERLKESHGESKASEARKYAEVVFQENNLQVVEAIIYLTDEYGKEKVKEAYGIVSQKEEDNPKRTQEYVVGILKNL